MKKIILILIIALMLTGYVFAHQVTKAISLEAAEGYIFNYDFTTEGYIIATGGTTYGGLGAEDDEKKLGYLGQRAPGDLESTALIMKYSQDGSLITVKTFGGDKFDYFVKAFETKDGGFIASGYTDSYRGGDFNLNGVWGNQNNSTTDLIVKYNRDLEVEWAISNGEINYMPYVWEKDDTYYIASESSLYIINKQGQRIGRHDISTILGENIFLNGIEMSKEGDFYFIGDQYDGHKSKGVLKRTNSQLEEIYSKNFEADGSVFFYGLDFADGNILVQGSFYEASLSGDFNQIQSDLASDKAEGNMILIYNNEGEIVKGYAMRGGYDNNLMTVAYHGQLSNKDYLLGYTLLEDGLFYDPLSKKEISVKAENLYLYRYNLELEAKDLFVISEQVHQMYEPYVAQVIVNEDRSFDLVLKNRHGGLKLINIVDSAHLEEALARVNELEEEDYDDNLWAQLLADVELARNALEDGDTKQDDLNSIFEKLEQTISNLKVKEENNDKELPKETNPPTDVGKRTSKSSIIIYLVTVIPLAAIIIVLLILLLKKK